MIIKIIIEVVIKDKEVIKIKIIKINMKEFGNTTKDMVKVKFKKKGVYKW